MEIGHKTKGNNSPAIGSIEINNLIDHETEKLKSKLRFLPKWVYWVWLISITSLAFSLVCFCVFVFPYTNWDINAVSTGIILGFVGILATFIVVGNYMQTKQIEKDFYEKVQAIKDNYDEKIEKEVLPVAEKVKHLQNEVRENREFFDSFKQEHTNNLHELFGITLSSLIAILKSDFYDNNVMAAMLWAMNVHNSFVKNIETSPLKEHLSQMELIFNDLEIINRILQDKTDTGREVIIALKRISPYSDKAVILLSNFINSRHYNASIHGAFG